MGHRPSIPPDDHRRWHAIVEQYTPDGALGRLLLAAVTGSVASFGFFLTVTLVLASSGLLPALAALVTGGITLLALLLTATLLWPVYLSLIGNIETAANYRVGKPTTPAAQVEESDDEFAILKRRYAAGELSEDEFERRLDDLLAADEAMETKDEGRSGRIRDAALEPERE